MGPEWLTGVLDDGRNRGLVVHRRVARLPKGTAGFGRHERSVEDVELRARTSAGGASGTQGRAPSLTLHNIDFRRKVGASRADGETERGPVSRSKRTFKPPTLQSSVDLLVALSNVARRLDIELTSCRDDGNWTWRAAGARQPKGELDGALLPDSVSVGDVLKVEADAHLEGLDITTVFAPKPQRPEPERLKLLPDGSQPLVSAKLASKRSRRKFDAEVADGDSETKSDHRGRKELRDGERQARRRTDGHGQGRADKQGRHDKQRRADKQDGAGSTRDRIDRRGKSRPARDDKDRKGKKSDKTRKDGQERDRARGRDRPRRDRTESPAKPRAQRLKAKRVHRRAALEALPADQHPLAEEILQGGVPGVRQTIFQMNQKAKAEGLPSIKADPLIVLAERMAPGLKAAEWHDRADAAWAGIHEIDLRDIRSVIVAADRAARTEETRTLAANIRAGLVARVETEHRQWLDELSSLMTDGRTVRALRLSSHPPKAGSPLPPDMAERLARSAAENLDTEVSQQRWATVADAVAFSPVRTQVTPVGIPAQPNESLLSAIRKVADRIPQIAAMFGMEPDPPRRRRGRTTPPPPKLAAAGPTPDKPDTTTPDTTTSTGTGPDTPAPVTPAPEPATSEPIKRSSV